MLSWLGWAACARVRSGRVWRSLGHNLRGGDRVEGGPGLNVMPEPSRDTHDSISVVIVKLTSSQVRRLPPP